MKKIPRERQTEMKDRLKTGITHTSYGVYEYPEYITKISSHGYECVDFQSFVDIESDFFNLPLGEFESKLKNIRASYASHGLEISQAHSPWRYPPRDNDPEERVRWLAAMKKAIYGTHVLGCSRFVVHPLMPYLETAEGADEVWEMNLSFIGELADYAKAYGVTVCVENLPFPDYPLASVEAVCKLVDALNRDNLRVCLDTGHAAIFKGADIGSAVRIIGSRLEAVHIHDNMGKVDEHLIPGDGIIDWDGFALALWETGFNKVISLETSAKHRLHPECEWEQREMALASIAKDIATKAKG